ncbi:hypothetical protein B9N43_10515 [Denitratisoma sp. DHT3]|uniref:metallophosphoesterase family protein n=1 Tax=Denitratisoma sp. DHT3 TaxID=1981880 RepID=UPI0011984C68|nr:metallophosphoesterase [Denitratisoma sp. DHT3]QDX81647.1 hypothetical protein B9N43_10515 [Denitratisoma sp. DHT3]
MAELSFAVISDLHAFVDAKNSSNSSLQFGTAALESRNPLVNLIEYVRRERVTADILVCAGDICNQADLQGFSSAWSRLQELNAALGSRQLVSTCGNHDLNSRYLKDRSEDDDPDPKGALLCQTPGFPFDDPAINNQYWAQNFVFVDLASDCCTLVLNTSAYHGGREEEIEHGRVSQRTIDAILCELAKWKDKQTFVLVCHHHLMPMTSLAGKTDYQYVHKGAELLEKLERATRKSWLVIHGHRHHPRLVYGQASTSCAPIIFGSSSLGARLTGIPNQFHLIELKKSNQSDHSSIVGTVKTWSWTETTEWSQAGRSNLGMPTICGFGFKGQVGCLADELSKLVGTAYITWSEALGTLPSLNYLTPEHLEQLEDELELRGIAVNYDRTGLPSQIAPRAT